MSLWKILLFFFVITILPSRLVLLVVLGYIIYILWQTFAGESFSMDGRKIVIPKVKKPTFNFNTPTAMNLKLLSLPIILGIIFVLIIIDGLVSVPVGHVAVIYDRGRGVLADELPEGLHLKIPFWQVATKLDTRLQVYTMAITEGEGAQYGADAIEALTRDGQKVDLDITIQYLIPADNAASIFQKIGLSYEEKIIRPAARSVVRDVVTAYDSVDLFKQETRTAAGLKMEETLRALYEAEGFELSRLLLRNVRFSADYLDSIERKQITQQRIQTAEYELEIAEVAKKKRIVEAQAEAEAIRLKGEILRRNPEVIQLEFVNKMAPQINWGILPSGALPLIDLKGFNQ